MKKRQSQLHPGKIISFADHIFTSRHKRRIFGDRDFFDESHSGKTEVPPFGFLLIKFLVAGLILVLFGRLFFLTVISGSKLRELAEGNRIKLVEIEAPRGRIYDRGGKLLADSRDVYLLKKGFQIKEIDAKTKQELEDQGLAGENLEGDLGSIIRKLHREYFLSEAASSVLGYISAPTDEDLKGRQGISQVERVGRSGIEASFDNFLKGEPGKKLIEVDASGKQVSVIGAADSKSGRDLYLTVDSDLQKVVFAVLKKRAQLAGSSRGAVIVSDVARGEILALVSYPSFDGEDVAKSLNDKNNPFLNRAVQGVYPPGSIFKIVTALSALETGKITSETEIEDVGEFYLSGTRFVNWFYLAHGGRDGILKIEKAIARSNDIFFYKVAERIGLSPIRRMAIKFGFGQKTGIDLPDEALGLVGDEVWKKSTQNTDWYLGDTLHLSIGQGFVLATPIQINMLTAYMASGKLVKPYLVTKIGPGQNQPEIKVESKILGENLALEQNFQTVREGMRQACETGGTGWPFFNAPYKVGCKTGTAERALGNPHAWFTAFAPFEKPQLSITVIIEDGGEGSSVAAPVAREILDWLYEQDKNLNIKN